MPTWTVMKLRGPSLSIKTKLFLAITLVPFFALTLFLAQSLSIFKKDKIAYVYDSSLSFSRTKAFQVTSEIRAFQGLLKSLTFNIRSDRRDLSASGELQFKDDTRIAGFELWQASEDANLAPVLLLKKHKETLPSLPPPTMSTPSGTESPVSIGALRSPDGGFYLTLSAPLTDPSSSHPLTARLIVNGTNLARSFDESAAHASFLASADGTLLLGPTGYAEDAADFKLSSGFREIRGQQASSGTMEVTSASGRAYLASYARLAIGGLTVISAAEKRAAMSAAETLMLNAAWLFLGLLTTTLILSAFSTRQLTSALDKLFEATKKVGQGHFGVKVEVTSRDEIGDLAQSFNLMSSEVERLVSELTLKARMEAELQTAKAVQATLFPPPYASLGPLDIAGSYEPASECGGDWWFYTENERYVNVFIGDVTGHGAPAALLTSAAHAACVVAGQMAELSPGQYLSFINRALYSSAKGQLTMTFFIARIEKATGLLTYSIASHEAPLLLSAATTEARWNSFSLLGEMNNRHLGEILDCEFREAQIQLAPGDRIFLYTDGVHDLQSPDQQNLGERRMGQILAKSLMQNQTSQTALETVVHDLNKWRNGQMLNDDVTAVILTYKGQEATKSAA